ncbi:MAG TPA: c-type cytochrome domain-containing protein [Terriglobia bacterium]|nr:c-type cytochrome domain-containing protein [Terriglobia bacterium]
MRDYFRRKIRGARLTGGCGVPPGATLAAAFIVILALAPARAAAQTSASPSAATPSFSGQIAPLLQKNCFACHNGSTKMGELVMESYALLMKGGKHGAVIVPGKSGESRIVLMLQGSIQPRMPYGGDPLPAAEIAMVKAWIDAGAMGPVAGEAVAPAPALNIPDIKPQVAVVSPIGSIAYSPDGKWLAVGGYKEVRLLDAATGKLAAALGGHADLVRSVAFSPDGKWLVTGGGLPARSGEIKIWDVESHQLIRTIAGHKDCIYSVAVSHDGKLIASGSYDKLVKLWDPSTGAEIRTLKDHIDAVFAVAFSPDGKRLASGAQDRTVKIWDIATGQRLFTLSDALDGVTSITYRPSGKQIAAAGYDKQIHVWDITDKGGSLSNAMIADEDSILALAYTPDGKMLVSTSADRSIRFRDADTLNPVSVLDNQPDWVEAISISPDGKRLAAGRYNGTVSVYDMTTYGQVLGPLVAFEPSVPPPAAHQTASR